MKKIMSGKYFIKKIYLKIYRWLCVPIVKCVVGFAPVKKNKIVFDNFLGRGYGDNPKYIAEEFIRAHKGYDLVWLTDDKNENFPKQIRSVKYGSPKAFYELATAKVWIDNVRNTDRPRKKRKQVYLQTWHGSFGFKYIEKDAEEKLSLRYVSRARKDGKISDAILSNSYFLDNQYRRIFWLRKDVKILPFGLPRNDKLINNANNNELIDRIKQKLHISGENYTVLYVPTFRDGYSVEGYKLAFEDIKEAFSEKMNKKCKILVRFHPNVQNQSSIIEYSDDIIDVTLYPDIQELILIADAGISDYSSTPFDFAILHKPVFICALDLEYYKNTRGLIDEYYSMPFPFAKSNLELISNILKFDYEKYCNSLERFFDTHPSYDQGDASRKTVDWIIEMMESK